VKKDSENQRGSDFKEVSRGDRPSRYRTETLTEKKKAGEVLVGWERELKKKGKLLRGGINNSRRAKVEYRP